MARNERAFTLVELLLVVLIVGVLAVLSIYGVHKYVASSKSSEARNSLGQIGKDAATAFERETMAGAVLAADGSTTTTHALCASTEKTVPASITSISGKKYQSSPAALEDWNGGEATNKGFPCLKFSMQAPQYYMYNYSSDGNVTTPVTGTQFTATANGDLNGDGVYSTFTVVGAVANNQLFLGPNIVEIDPEE